MTRGLLVAVAVMAVASSAHAEGRPPYGETVIASTLEQPMTIDPVEVQSHTDVTVCALIFDTLYRVKGDIVVPHLALGEPDLSEPGLARIALRPGIEFHDGSTLSAVDVAASLRRLQASEASWLLGAVKNIEVDDEVVVLHLTREAPRIAWALASPRAGITQRGLKPSFRRAIGSGPFRLVQKTLQPGELTLDAFERHFAGRSYVDRLRLRWYDRADAEARAFETGTSQISLRGAVAFAGHRPKYRSDEIKGPSTVLAFVGFGTRNDWLTNDRQFRKALSLGISRGALRGIGSGEEVVPALSPLPPGFGGRTLRPAQLRADLSAAREALAKVGDHDKLQSSSLRLEILVNRTRPDDRSVAGKIAAALFKLRIDSQIVEVGAEEFAARVAQGKCDLYVGQLAHFQTGEAGQLLLAMEVGGRGPLGARAREPWRRLEAQFASELPIVPLFHRAVKIHFRKDIHGLTIDDSARIAFENLFFFGGAAKN